MVAIKLQNVFFCAYRTAYYRYIFFLELERILGHVQNWR
jgi:hypothetical protein